ncbi:hypothetical protein CCHL11_05686 [Colletotrichum chlorophyti]|uniref:DUF7730 domain-containing protein n=1 Tax=Colletotrichum chlorophyti TaxID=708187 RepID=A0A1Q8RTI2_9PEZI|nr:hypothetical protein CCHL11_05686 [Colletotrichum chlorophyti]
MEGHQDGPSGMNPQMSSGATGFRDDGQAHKPPSQGSSLQLQSQYFCALPLEIRQSIYKHVWIAAGSTQHVYKSSASSLAPLSHCVCNADPDAEDVREIELTRVLATPPADPTTVEGGVGPGSEDEKNAINDWRFRVVSSWSNHWSCEEEPPTLRAVGGPTEQGDSREGQRQLRVKEFSPFLAILLTCKRMHDEAIDSIYKDTTFSFIGTDPLSRFLQTTSQHSLIHITKLHLIWRAPIETYMELDADESVLERAKWKKIWTDVAFKVPRLKELRIWAYPCYPRYPMPHEEWFATLHQFGNVPDFSISLRWFQHHATPDTGPLDFLEAAPFDYDRIPPVSENPLHFHWRRLVGLDMDEPRVPLVRRQRAGRYRGRSGT